MINCQVHLVDLDGNTQAVVTDFLSLTFEQGVNEKGEYRLDFMTDDEAGSLVDNGWLVDFRRNSEFDTSLLWPNRFYGIHREIIDKKVAKFSDGQILKQSSSIGTSLNGILDLPEVLWPKGSAEASKTTDPVTAVYEYVNENLGVAALAVSDRWADNVMANLSVNLPIVVTGLTYENEHSYDRLLSALQDITAFSLENGQAILFNVSYDGAGQYSFDVGFPTDKTNTAIDTTTALNGSGNKPVILSIDLGNIRKIERKVNYSNAANVIAALGCGESVDRRVRIREDAVAHQNLGILRRERSINNENQSDNASLDTAGDRWLEQLRARPQYYIEPYQANSFIFHDYNVGDLVTLRDEGVDYTVWITYMRASYARSSSNPIETIELELTVIE